VRRLAVSPDAAPRPLLQEKGASAAGPVNTCAHFSRAQWQHRHGQLTGASEVKSERRDRRNSSQRPHPPRSPPQDEHRRGQRRHVHPSFCCVSSLVPSSAALHGLCFSNQGKQRKAQRRGAPCRDVTAGWAVRLGAAGGCKWSARNCCASDGVYRAAPPLRLPGARLLFLLSCWEWHRG
jgi:hypothetical protein